MDTRHSDNRFIQDLKAAAHSPAVMILGGLLLLMVASLIACAPAYADSAWRLPANVLPTA
jgi:hypothetical protein